MDKFDVCIAGAGVLGLAIAYQLSKTSRYSSKSILLLEKESNFGQITSSRNSEVIHAGIYYATDSLKAKLCVTGKELLYEHLEKYDVPYRKLGKLIVAQAGEEDELESINAKAKENGVLDLRFISQHQLQKMEPQLSASAALLSPSTGIIDSHSYMQSLLHLGQSNGVVFSPNTNISGIDRLNSGFVLTCSLTHGKEVENYNFQCAQLINAAGLNAQQLAQQIDGAVASEIPRLYPCKGDYFSYSGPSPFERLIYPIPEKNHTGLGIHSTMDIGGQTRFGPDTEYLSHGSELNYAIDASKSEHFSQAIRRYFPSIDPQKLYPSYAGIRPKIAGPGEAAADFDIQRTGEGLIQLFGMESPALTSSLSIARYVVDLMD